MPRVFFADKIRGVLSGFDRVVLTGTFPDLCHAEAMARFQGARDIRLFDYPKWAAPFRDTIRTHPEQLAREHGLMIEFIRRLKAFRQEIADWARAQALADAWNPHRLHRQLDRIAAAYCPVLGDFPAGVPGSVRQAEYATDVVFARQAAFQPLYAALIRTAIHAGKPGQVATFRSLDFLSAIEDPRPGLRAVEKLATPMREGERSYRGFNLFHGPDLDLFRTSLRATLGRTVATAALKPRELVLIPMLNHPVAA